MVKIVFTSVLFDNEHVAMNLFAHWFTFIYNCYRSKSVGDDEVAGEALPEQTDVTEETEVSLSYQCFIICIHVLKFNQNFFLMPCMN